MDEKTVSSAKSEIAWEDHRLFLAVARAGGLSGAGRATGLSPATLGRRMLALERALDQRLFRREPGGYRLTEAGRELVARAEDMERAALAIEAWRDGRAPRATVRVSAGTWTSWFLARHIGRLHRPDDAWTFEFVTANATLDIGRRHADIGIRNHRPEDPWMAARNLGPVRFAAYRARGTGGDLPWIGVGGDGAVTPFARWVEARHGTAVTLRGNDPRLLLDLVLAGAGRTVFPAFVGESHPGLVRDGDLIAELTRDQWLAMHAGDRHVEPVRTAIDRLAGLIAEHRAAFEGLPLSEGEATA
jgi:DNA-binding transcriptional LysR family regulator